MLKRLIAAVLALIFVILPSLASAQDTAKPAEAAVAAKVFINYDPAEDPENILYLDLSTGKRVTIRLMPVWAPNAVERIKTLARRGFYNGVIFHRVIDGFMAQTGDPTGTGKGGSDLPNLKAEFNPMPHVRGTVSMARADDPDSANSQFFIMFQPRFSLDRKYSNFGRVIAGMDAVDEIQRGEPPENPTKILQASIGADNKPQVTVAPQAAPAISADALNNSTSEPDNSGTPPATTQAPPEAQQAPAPAPAPAGQ